MNVNCCCNKGAADSMEDAEFPCFDCPRHPYSLMRDSRYRCKRHASQAAGSTIQGYAQAYLTLPPMDSTRAEAERVALKLVAHAATTAKKLGGTTPEDVCEVVSRSVHMNVPDPEFAELIIAYVRELTISEESA